MKIGIITHPLHTNYGGIMQNYALQTVLRDLGHDPITYRFSLTRSITNWIYINFIITIKKIAGDRVKYKEAPWHYDKRMSGLESFISTYINCTPKSKKDVSSDFIVNNNLEALVVGSDQVWRPKYVKNIYNMYLDFASDVDIKRIAYAASFGTDKWEYTEEQKHRCSTLLRRFDKVSVREKSAILLCSTHFSIKAECVLDPTLLLSQSSYLALCSNINTKQDKYLLVFLLDKNPHKMEYAHQLARDLKLNIYILNTGEEINESDTIENWLASFRDASFIITDSYHGTIFSIIFKKQFLTFYNAKRGNTRMDNLFSLFNLYDCCVAESSYNSHHPNINWNNVESKLNDIRDLSLNFLINAFN